MMDIALEYELLIRRVFDCRKNEDPLKLANADRFNMNTDINLLRFSLLYVLKKIAIDLELLETNYKEQIKSIKNFDNIVWDSNADEIDSLVLDLNNILDSISEYKKKAL